MAASYNNRPPGSRSGSLEVIDDPPSYVNRAYATTGSTGAVAAAAAGQVPLAYGRRYQPHVTTSTSGQRLYNEQAARGQSPSQLLEQGFAVQQPLPGLYGERSTTSVNGAQPRQQQQPPRSQSPGRYLEEGSIGGRSRSSPQPPMYSTGSASPGSYGQPAPGGAGRVAGYHADVAMPARPSVQGRLLYSQKPYFSGYNSARYSRPKHTSVTREPGYYNLNTDTVVRAKKHRNKTFLYVGRPWTKGFSTTPRDFLPLAVMAIFFSPPLGVVALVFALLSRHSTDKEDYGAAGYRGRIAFWTSISAVIVGIVCWIVIVAAINGYRFIGHRIH